MSKPSSDAIDTTVPMTPVVGKPSGNATTIEEVRPNSTRHQAPTTADSQPTRRDATRRLIEGLPIGHLMATPFLEATNAQLQLAHATTEFIQKTCIDESGHIRQVAVTYDGDSASNDTVKTTVQVPLLSVLNIPALSIQKVGVSFAVDVVDIESTEKAVADDVATWSGWGASSSAKSDVHYVTQSKLSKPMPVSHTTATSIYPTYQIHIDAVQETPIGLQHLLQMLRPTPSVQTSSIQT